MPRIALGAGLFVPLGKLISQRFAELTVSNKPARQGYGSANVTKAASAAFVASASVTPLCGVLEV